MKEVFRKFGKRLYYNIPYTWRVPRVYNETLAQITSCDNQNLIKEWQIAKLKVIVNHAYQNTAGYHQLFSEAGVKPDDIRTLEDIKLLPFVDKEIMRDNIKDFLARDIPHSRRLLTKTSGTSGTPFCFYRTMKEEWIEQAFVAKAWSNGGWNLSQSGFMLRGGYAGDAKHIVKKCNNGSFYVHNNSYLVSPNYLTEEYYPIYRQFLLNNQELDYAFAIPSALTLLSQLIISHHDEGISQIEAIYLGSESVFNWQIDYIKRAFPAAKVISLYGQTERVIMAYWCAQSHKYHIDPFYGVTEILNGNKEVKAEERGELVGTSFWNFTTPFIRYRTNDYAIRSGNLCEDCNLPYSILESIEGRLQDVLVSRNNRYISICSFDGSLEHGSLFNGIVKFKLVQYEIGQIELLIQVEDEYTNEMKKSFESAISKYLGDDFSLDVKIVDKIQPCKNGKFRSIEQHLPIDVEKRVLSI